MALPFLNYVLFLKNFARKLTMLKPTAHFFCLIVILNICSKEAVMIRGSSANKARNDEYPSVVSIGRDSRSLLGAPEAYHKCTGTLVSPNLVLTAAHCFRHINDYKSFVVKVGSADLRSAEIHEIDWWVTYNEWLENQLVDEHERKAFHDIAVVKLAKNVSSSIKIVKLTTVDDSQLYDKDAITAGWGKTSSEEKPKDLHIATMHVLPPEDCLFNKIYIGSIDGNEKKALLCTTSQPSVCLKDGDSGGPLLGNKTRIIGVNVGHCFQNVNSELPEFQNIHSSVNYYRRFIYDVIQSG